MTPEVALAVDVIVRAMKLQDLDRVYAIERQSFSLPWPERSFRFELDENPNSRLWVAEVRQPEGNRAVVGMLVMWVVVDEAHIGTFAIHPAYRQKGIATRLLAHVLIKVGEAGVRRVFLEVRRSNQAAQNLYKRFGFVVEGVRRGYYRDSGEDALLMSLDPLQADVLRRQEYSDPGQSS